ncbi:alpha/beta hydrolase [Arthrobacter sp. efr-133-TYG-118]|uniref:alpha/beta hydrolase n=1 Tax=Arthrobacter sp. efr-133-TYG-118 TaxID=3040279 RepID=UPI0025510DF2|nr:alpha/beta hydrolase [Arthrobacter sp. efr-133-TYG-118]
MTNSQTRSPGALPAPIPIPTTISAEAQAMLLAMEQIPKQPQPVPEDVEGWRALVAVAADESPETVEAVALVTTASVVTDVAVAVEPREAGGAKYFVATPDNTATDDDRVLLFIHGGGFTFGAGPVAHRSTELVAGCYGVRTWGMDYRQLPDDPFPAGLDDCMAVYRQLLTEHRAESIAIAGQSGGANLTAALLLRARDEGLPLPAAVGLISPPADLTQSGDTYQTNGFTIPQGGLTNMARFYAGGYELDHPYVSPLFGTYSSDFPPTILTAGTRDFLLSDTVRLHRKLLHAGVRAELHVWEGAPHGMFMGRAPEDREQVAQVRRFLEDAWSAAARA